MFFCSLDPYLFEEDDSDSKMIECSTKLPLKKCGNLKRKTKGMEDKFSETMGENNITKGQMKTHRKLLKKKFEKDAEKIICLDNNLSDNNVGFNENSDESSSNLDVETEKSKPNAILKKRKLNQNQATIVCLENNLSDDNALDDNNDENSINVNNETKKSTPVSKKPGKLKRKKLNQNQTKSVIRDNILSDNNSVFDENEDENPSNSDKETEMSTSDQNHKGSRKLNKKKLKQEESINVCSYTNLSDDNVNSDDNDDEHSSIFDKEIEKSILPQETSEKWKKTNKKQNIMQSSMVDNGHLSNSDGETGKSSITHQKSEKRKKRNKKNDIAQYACMDEIVTSKEISMNRTIPEPCLAKEKILNGLNLYCN